MYQIGNVSYQQQHPHHVSPKQEAVRVGNLTVVAQHGKEALSQLTQRFLARSYRVTKTRHFVICQKPSSTHMTIMHAFGQAEMDADLICWIEQELSPCGFISSAKTFGVTLFAVLASAFPAPRHQPTIWRTFCLNTLTKLHDQIAYPPAELPAVSYIAPFAIIYRRVMELYRGQSLLDVGCSFGFFPLLMAEQRPNAFIMGCDNNPDALQCSTDLAAVTGAYQVKFTLQDVLKTTMCSLGTFDTVTALHVLEHLTERDLPVALRHLLQVTSKRLIIAVPYEERATAAYGHEQVFTRAKLERWGQCCVEMLGGSGRYWCEDVAGGLLVVELCDSIVS